MANVSGLGEIRYPQPARAAHLDGYRQHFIEGVEKRKLDHHRQTSAHGIDAVLLIQLHHFLLLFRLFGIANRESFEASVNRGDLRLQRLHLFGGFHAADTQREEQKVDRDGDHHDSPAVVVHQMFRRPVQDQETGA